MERQALAGLVFAVRAWAQTGGASWLDEAFALMKDGNLRGAEQTLRGHADADSLGLLAVVLDQENRLNEADGAYRSALKLAPRSAPLLNNYGNHLITAGKHDAARAMFLRVIAIDPGHRNAHVQLARIALEHRQPRQALDYLNKLPPAASEPADITWLRMQCLYAVHRDADGDALLHKIEDGPHENAAVARALASVGQFEKSRRFYAAALAEKGDNPSLLYEAATVEASLNAPETALAFLARAAKLAPDRADIQQLLARTTGQLGYAGDAADAWARYSALAPQDDEGRRERGFSRTAAGGDTRAAIEDLRWFANRHPDDPVGHYELGTAIAATAPDQARVELDRAIKLRPDLTGAHVARGILDYRQGNFTAALADFRIAAEHNPKNAAVLDRVGETYLALHQQENALPWLRKAVDLAPAEPRMQLHLGRALSSTGNAEEASRVLARFRNLGADKSTLAPASGIVDFLNLSPAEQYARYRAGVEKTVREHPENAQAQVRNLGLLLERGDAAGAETAIQTILALKPAPSLLSEATDLLVEAKQYALAERLIGQADEKQGLSLDLAVATFYLEGAQAATPILAGILPTDRDGNYYLAQALVLFGSDRLGEGKRAVAQALEKNATRADLFRDTATVLMGLKAYADARKLLDAALQRFPENAELIEAETNAQRELKP